MAIAAADLAEALGPAPPLLTLVGVEHEYAVRAGPLQLDFREIIERLPIGGHRIDPRDWYAHRCSWGGVITCDGKEAEIACPPVALARGFDREVVAVGETGEAALRAALPGHLDLVPFSTHISVSAPDPLPIAARLAQTAAAGMVGESCGVIVRARPGRVEVCFEPLHGEALGRMARFVAGAVVALTGDLDALGPPLGLRTEPGIERPGWYVDRVRSLSGVEVPDYERRCALGRLPRPPHANPWPSVLRPGLVSVTWDLAVFDIGGGVAAVPSPWLPTYLSLLDAGELDVVLRDAPRRGRLRSWAQTSSPGTYAGVGDTAGLVTPEPTAPTVAIATRTGKDKPPGQEDKPPFISWLPPWWWIAIAILVLVAIIGFFLTSGGDDDDVAVTTTTTTTSTTTSTTTTTAAPTTTVRTSLPPTNLSLFVGFNQATYTTSYQVVAADPEADPLEYLWTFAPAEPTCGVITTDGQNASWQHPHESQRDQVPGFPADRFCADTTTGHAGTVTVVVSDGVNRCEVVWTEGAEPGLLGPVPCSG